MLLNSIPSNEYASTMLFSILPESFIATTIGPGVNAVAIFPIVDVRSFIDSAITPRESSVAVHLVV